MKKIFSKATKGVKKMLEIPKEIYNEVINSKEIRLILGLLCMGAGIGIGGALILSAYMKIPQ